jgi:hypothetical protein
MKKAILGPSGGVPYPWSPSGGDAHKGVRVTHMKIHSGRKLTYWPSLCSTPATYLSYSFLPQVPDPYSDRRVSLEGFSQRGKPPSWRSKQACTTHLHSQFIFHAAHTAIKCQKEKISAIGLKNKQIRSARLLLTSPKAKLRSEVVQVKSTWINNKCAHRSSDVKVVIEKSISYTHGTEERLAPIIKVFCGICTSSAKVFIERSITTYMQCVQGSRRSSTITENLCKYSHQKEQLKPLPQLYTRCIRSPCYTVSFFSFTVILLNHNLTILNGN